MNTKTEVKAITILGRKWFDKVNGNTYHSAQIMVNGVTVHKTGMRYGYGNQYVHTASTWLEENGYIKLERPTQALWSYCHDNDIHCEYSEVYCLKREL